jgi:hypothetical protein
MQRLAEDHMTATHGERKSVGRRTLLATAIAALGLSCVTDAHADPSPVDLTVVNRDTGQPLRTWRHDGRLFVAGQPGARYGLRVTNHTDGRVLVVMSVDGVNVLTGETAGYDQQGYIFGPHETYDVTGWRKSLTEVAAFNFARLSESYAARTGRPDEVGVIGIAVFDEKAAEPVPETEGPPAPPTWRDEPQRGADSAGAMRRATPPAPSPPPAAAVAPNAAAGLAQPTPSDRASGYAERQPDERLGTAHGAREWSVTRIVPFERATPFPQLTRQIEYDTYDHLVASGVIPTWQYGERRPRPFPTTPDAGFVPDPPSEP